jgi:phosphohistidine phosphatase
MKQLMLLRHFKSSSHEPGRTDRDRALAPRGQHDAVAMAETMVAGGLIPDRILCSPARRTRETLTALQPGLGDVRDVIFIEGLYAGSDMDYRDIIAANGGDSARLLLIGHNPRIHVTALTLVGGGDRGSKGKWTRLAEKYPTGALAVIGFDAQSWSAIAEGSGQLETFIQPRELGDT